MSLDLPLIWAAILAIAVMMYVMLDGFDLGVGILFPFTGSPAERDLMMASVAPVWDGNETWLVLGGGGLFAAFPFAYAALLPALYAPVIVMLLALILRGVAFEFRLRARARGKALWTAAFAAGSLVATLAQGLVLGGFIQGVTLKDGQFAGDPWDWLSPYSALVAAGLVAGYALLGAGWLVWRTEGELQARARRWAWIAVPAVAVLLAVVSFATLLVHPEVAARWGWRGCRRSPSSGWRAWRWPPSASCAARTAGRSPARWWSSSPATWAWPPASSPMSYPMRWTSGRRPTPTMRSPCCWWAGASCCRRSSATACGSTGSSGAR